MADAQMPPVKKAKKEQLTLAQRQKILAKLDAGASERTLSNEFGVGKGSIGRIKANRDNLVNAADSVPTNTLKKRKHVVPKLKYEDIEKVMVEFLRMARDRGLVVTGPMLRTLALEEAEKKGIADFSASEGWLSRVKQRHDIVGKALCGEAAAVDPILVADWKSVRLPKIIKDYKESDVFNCDETGLFFLQSSNRSLNMPGDDAHGVKQDKKRLTLLLTASWMGEKEKPLMIWKSENPRALKGADKSKLPVTYRSQGKAWMTIPLFKEWIKEFDSHKHSQGRKVLLLMDNASVHRIDDAQIKRLKATQIAFFPANTTSQLQTMDAGIIQAFKLYYRQSLHSHIMHKVKDDITCNPLKDVTIALAIVWVFRAWYKVNPRTISKCFAKCGFKGTDDTGTAAVTADLPLPELAAGDTEELALSAAEMEDNNIFPPIAKAEDLFIEASDAIDAEAQRIAGQGLMVKAGLDAEEHKSDDEAEISIPTSKAVMEAVKTIQLYAMARGDEQVLSSPVDLNHYQEIVAGRRLAEQEQTQITDYYVCPETV